MGGGREREVSQCSSFGCTHRKNVSFSKLPFAAAAGGTTAAAAATLGREIIKESCCVRRKQRTHGNAKDSSHFFFVGIIFLCYVFLLFGLFG